MPFTGTIRVRAAHAALLEEPPRRLPVVLLRLAGASRLLLKRGIYLARKHLERGDMSPRAWAHGAREENAEGGETEATLALLGSRTPGKNADAAMGVVNKVTVGRKRAHQKRMVETGGRGVVHEAIVAHLHNIMLYEVQSAGKCAKFHAFELYI